MGSGKRVNVNWRAGCALAGDVDALSATVLSAEATRMAVEIQRIVESEWVCDWTRGTCETFGFLVTARCGSEPRAARRRDLVLP